MNNQKVNASLPKKSLKVEVPGEAPPVGAAPKRLRSASMAPQVQAASTRDYGKAPIGPERGFGLGG